MKFCSKCKTEKEDSAFSKKQTRCRSCVANYNKRRPKKTKDIGRISIIKIKKETKNCNNCKEEKPLTEFPKGRGVVCKICKRLEWNKKSKKRKQYHYDYGKKYYEENRDVVLEKRRIYEEKNKESIREKNKIRAQTPEAKNARRLQKNKLRKENLQYRVSDLLRGYVRRAVLMGGKKNKTFWLLDCTIGFFIKHIESLFLEGMTWENYGKNGWHFEHRIPLVAFDMKITECQQRAFHWANYRPMWEKENLQKNGKFNPKHLEIWLSTPIEKLHELVEYDFKPILEYERQD